MTDGPALTLTSAKAVDDEAMLAQLDAMRARTFRLVSGLRSTDLRRAPHPALGPIAWDLGHITTQWDIWLAQTLGGLAEARPDHNDRYDAYKHPRPTRAALPLLDLPGALAYSAEVRARAAAVLAATPPGARTGPLWDEWSVHKLMVRHDAQHAETILQGLQCLPAADSCAPGRRAKPPRPARTASADAWVHIPAGPFPMGVPRTPRTYDNEWPQHRVDVAAFDLATHPVTNADWLRFMAADGYSTARHWDPRGFERVTSEGFHQPMHWEECGGHWMRKESDRWVPLDPDEPVVHVSWYEADAYARWTGNRLPTEAEWEKAATWGPAGKKRIWPWGDEDPTDAHANLDQTAYGPAAVGSYPRGASAYGAQGLVGDVWEWTASDFLPYPGFQAFPYDEYSAIFFGPAYKVLRGGSFATMPLLRLGTFRNWDHPIRRQIFAGLRLARDAPSTRADP